MTDPTTTPGQTAPNMAESAYLQISQVIGAGPTAAILGLIMGMAALAVYARFSNQQAINQQKQHIRQSRAAVKQASDDADFATTMALSKQNLKAAFGLMRLVIVPSLAAALPVLAMALWLDNLAVAGPYWEWWFFIASLISGGAIKIFFKLA